MENNIDITKKPRIEYIDSMRGFTMILVVYWHLSLRYNLINENFNEVFLTFRMPLFFFISGFFSFTSFTKAILKKKIYNRIFGQLIPTLIVASLFIALFRINIIETIFDINKKGYWFTITLFEIFIIYAIIKFILDYTSTKSKIQDIIFICIIILFSILTIPSHILDNYGWWKILSGYWFVKYTPFFFLGVMKKKYLFRFLQLIHNKIFMFVSAILFLFFIFQPSTIGRAVQAYLGILIVFTIFERFQNKFNHTTTIGRNLSIIGKQTLPIYLLHYFLMGGVSSLQNFAYSLSLNNSWLTGCIITLIISLLIIFACLAIEKAMKISPILHALLFGFKK